MPFRRLAAGLGLALAVASGASAPLAAEPAHFDISVAGIRAGEITLSASRSGDVYHAGGRLRSTGLIGAVARLRFDGEATGRIDAAGRLVPDRYTASSRSTRSERETEIVFDNGAPVAVRVEPPRDREVDPAEQGGTIDPLSAAYALLLDTSEGAVCNRRVDLFDGSRRSQIAIGSAEDQDGAKVCNGLYTRVEGDSHSVSDQREWPFRLVFKANGSGTLELDRIETPTRFGLAVVSRRG
jgi:hypothetical protein